MSITRTAYLVRNQGPKNDEGIVSEAAEDGRGEVGRMMVKGESTMDIARSVLLAVDMVVEAQDLGAAEEHGVLYSA